MLDASRAVDVVASLIGGGAAGVRPRNRDEQEEIRESYATRREKPLLPYEQARANRLQIDWDEHVRSPRRRFSAGAFWTTCRSRRSRSSSTGRSSSRRGS